MSEEKQGALAGFKEFLMRGNVVDLAVAVVIGAAFTKIVNSVVEGFINPVVGAIGPKNLEEYTSCLKAPCEANADGEMEGILIQWGSVLSATLTFVITAAVVYFCMIMPMNRYKARQDAKQPVDDTPPAKTELDLLAEIRDALVAEQNGQSGQNGGVRTGEETAGAAVGSQRDESGTGLKRE